MMEKEKKLTKTTKVLNAIQIDIMNGFYQHGERLQMEALKARYKIGYSPLREALSRLVAHGLVEIEEQCGFKVSPLSLADFFDLYMIRVEIDTLGIKLAIERGDDVWEANLIAAWHQFAKYSDASKTKKIDPVYWRQLQKEFLSALMSGAQSPWLSKLSSMMYDQAIRYRTLCINENFTKKDWLAEYIKEYEQLVMAILDRDKEKAINFFCF